jgi:metallo-beta-lactamase class B
MSAKLPLAAALLLASCAPGGADLAVRSAPASELVAQCAGKDGWNDPAPPARIHGSTYLVGTCGISVVLVASPRGHVLIDGGTAKGAPLVAANVERLGFRMRDVRLILSSHEHFDHVGGLAELQRLSGAPVRASAKAGAVLAGGKPLPEDPQAGALDDVAPVRLGPPLREGEVVTVGPIRLTAHMTPGHAPGGTSWTWRSCEGRSCVDLAYVDSVSAVSPASYRFSAHPAYVATFRATLDKVAALPCNLLLTPHPGASNLFDRLAGKAPLVEAGSCAAYAARGRSGLDQRLAREAGR